MTKRKTTSNDCELGCIKYQGICDDAFEMARVLRAISDKCRDIAMCSEHADVIDPICRILMSCYAPYDTKYLNIKDKALLVKRARLVLDAYEQEVSEYEQNCNKRPVK